MLSKRAPALTQSTIASASSSVVAMGMFPLPELSSEKIGRTSKVQSGQIAGAMDPRLEDRIPATKCHDRRPHLMPVNNQHRTVDSLREYSA